MTLEYPPAPRYATAGEGVIINGVLGSNKHFNDSEWLGFEGKDFIATIDLAQTESLEKLTMRFFNGPGHWIYPPRQIEVLTSSDGETFDTVRKEKIESDEEKVIQHVVELDNVEARYIQIRVSRFGIIPEDRPGAGYEAWLFVDEILLQ